MTNHRSAKQQRGRGPSTETHLPPKLVLVGVAAGEEYQHGVAGQPPVVTTSILPMVSARPVRLLVASIGNPGALVATRHSAGHLLNQALASHLGFPAFQRSKLYGGGSVSCGDAVGRPELTLWQSGSLMNVSGVGLLKAWKAFTRASSSSSSSPHDPINGLVVLHDELETAPAQLKVRRGAEASARGHNGVRSVIGSLRGAAVLPALGDAFVRVGVGIGRPASRERGDVSAYVLGPVTRDERAGIEARADPVEQLLLREIARIGSAG